MNKATGPTAGPPDSSVGTPNSSVGAPTPPGRSPNFSAGPPNWSAPSPSQLDIHWLGLMDIVESFRRVPLWLTLGWYDFVLAYRRSWLGPAWEIVTMALWVSGLGVVFSRVTGREEGHYLAYIGVGVVLWQYLSSVIAGSAGIFTNRAETILSIRQPLYSFVLRHIVSCFARFMIHTIVVAPLVWFTDRGSPSLFWSAVGMVGILMFSLWASPLIAFVGARYRGFRHLLASGMRFLFFITPVFWRAEHLTDRGYLARANPFSSLLEIVRAPLLGETLWNFAWIVVLVLNSVGIAAAILVYGPCRRRVALWL